MKRRDRNACSLLEFQKFADQVDKVAALYTWGSRYSSHLIGGQNDQGKYWKAKER